MNLGSIILGDLVTLAERGTYQGILILVWALAGAIGPTIVRMHCNLQVVFSWLPRLHLHRRVPLPKTQHGAGSSVSREHGYSNRYPIGVALRPQSSIGRSIFRLRRSLSTCEDPRGSNCGEAHSY